MAVRKSNWPWVQHQTVALPSSLTVAVQACGSM